MVSIPVSLLVHLQLNLSIHSIGSQVTKDLLTTKVKLLCLSWCFSTFLRYTIVGLMLAFSFLSSPGTNLYSLGRIGGEIPKTLASYLWMRTPDWKDPQETEGLWTNEKIQIGW